MSDSLIDELADAEIRSVTLGRGLECKVCVALAGMTNERRDALKAALASKIGAEKLAHILNKHGIAIGRRAIVNHRKEGIPA